MPVVLLTQQFRMLTFLTGISGMPLKYIALRAPLQTTSLMYISLNSGVVSSTACGSTTLTVLPSSSCSTADLPP